MTAGTAEVIAAHWAQELPSLEGRTFALLCQAEGCGWGGEFLYTDHAAHVAEELAKAGFGNVQEALLTAADAMEVDPQFRDPLRLNSDRLRMYAHALDPEGRTLVQAIHDRKAGASG